MLSKYLLKQKAVWKFGQRSISTTMNGLLVNINTSSSYGKYYTIMVISVFAVLYAYYISSKKDGDLGSSETILDY